MHQVLLEVEGPRKSPKVLNEQIIQIPIFRMVHKTWKQYCTASSLLLYLHRNHNIPPANYFSSQNMYILKYANPQSIITLIWPTLSKQLGFVKRDWFNFPLTGVTTFLTRWVSSFLFVLRVVHSYFPGAWVAPSFLVCLSVNEGSVSPEQISTCFNI